MPSRNSARTEDINDDASEQSREMMVVATCVSSLAAFASESEQILQQRQHKTIVEHLACGAGSETTLMCTSTKRMVRFLRLMMSIAREVSIAGDIPPGDDDEIVSHRRSLVANGIREVSLEIDELQIRWQNLLTAQTSI